MLRPFFVSQGCLLAFRRPSCRRRFLHHHMRIRAPHAKRAHPGDFFRGSGFSARACAAGRGGSFSAVFPATAVIGILNDPETTRGPAVVAAGFSPDVTAAIVTSKTRPTASPLRLPALSAVRVAAGCATTVLSVLAAASCFTPYGYTALHLAIIITQGALLYSKTGLLEGRFQPFKALKTIAAGTKA